MTLLWEAMCPLGHGVFRVEINQHGWSLEAISSSGSGLVFFDSAVILSRLSLMFSML